ncbi:MAG: hypothetical protein IH810_04665 [Proteobacteria bacterium]|nr:hypothetical protein [Pseudomonadota bacterium]
MIDTALDIEFAGLPDYTNGAITVTIREVFEIDMPYSDTDLFQTDGTRKIQASKSNEGMYIHSGTHQTRGLVRNADDDWVISKINQRHGPFLPENSDKSQVLDLDEWFTGIDAGRISSI